jgi:hypothetical protein
MEVSREELEDFVLDVFYGVDLDKLKEVTDIPMENLLKMQKFAYDILEKKHNSRIWNNE